VNCHKFHQVSLDEGVPLAMSFYDIQTVPTRERLIKRKRRPLPSSTLTSDEHFKCLSEKKKKPEPKKAKREPKAMDPRVRKQQPKRNKSPPAAEKPKKSQPAAKKQNQEEQNVIGQTS